MKLAAGALAAAAAAVVLSVLVVTRCPIDRVPLPQPSQSSNFPPSNNLLQRAEKLGEGRLSGPEDVLFSGDGVLYTAARDGWVHRMHPNGSWEKWRHVGGPSLLGLGFSDDGGLLICDADKGLLSLRHDGSVAVLSPEVVQGRRIRLADEVVQAKDGTVYFTDASDKFGLDRWTLDFIESRPNGRLLRYDPRTSETSVVLDGLGFANGIALSAVGDFLVFCESTRFRCSKLWLEGERRGQTEKFIGDLPGTPDNIHIAPAGGSFWIALIQTRKGWLHRLLVGSVVANKVIAKFPALLRTVLEPVAAGAMVIEVSPDGKILRMLDDSDGSVMNFVTSATEFAGHLYLGSLATDFIGKLRLI